MAWIKPRDYGEQKICKDYPGGGSERILETDSIWVMRERKVLRVNNDAFSPERYCWWQEDGKCSSECDGSEGHQSGS